METFEVYSQAAELVDIYALRYQVYCLERGFLPASRYPARLESDGFDRRSAHFAARSSNGLVAGTVRLVLSKGEPFPFELHCPPEEGFKRPPPEECAEVSRLAVRRDYRRRTGDTFYGVNARVRRGRAHEPDGSERRERSPLLVLGLYREAYRFSRANGIRYWYAAMERSLVRMLARHDFDFMPIGPECDYYGPVTPYVADLAKVERKLRKSKPELLEWFQHGA